jgi:energy-coupling factor transporter ATP-binding protein EcfA2
VLVSFDVSNFKSIADTVSLSFVAPDSSAESAREAPEIGESVLTRTAIYGPNAAGKTNIIDALAWLVHAVRNSLRAWEDVVPLDPFAFDDRGMVASQFVVSCLVGDTLFQYHLKVTPERIVEERLLRNEGNESITVFDRIGEEISFPNTLDAPDAYSELITPTTLLVALARRFTLPGATEFANYIGDIAITGFRRSRNRVYGISSERMTSRIFDDEFERYPRESGNGDRYSSERREMALGLLRMADLGITDVKFEDVHSERSMPDGRIPVRRQPLLLHESASGLEPLSLRQESEGTCAWYELIAPVLSTLEKGTAIILDELDASLHPVLSAGLLDLFASKESNPNGAQLIFTTHDTSLLSKLSKGEVWFAEKGYDGATTLEPLSDYTDEGIRGSTESAYLHGRYGSVPSIKIPRLRALGLIG